MKTKFLLLIFALISFAISAQAEIRKYHGSDSSVIFSVEGTEFLVEGLYIAGNKEASRFSGYLDIYYDKQIAYICHVQFYHKINESFFDTGTNGVCWLKIGRAHV